MKILHVTDSFAPEIGGIERQVESLARHQLAAGHDVTIVTAVPATSSSDLKVVRSRAGRMRTSMSPLRLARLTRQTIDLDRADVVHAHVSIASPLAVRAVRIANRRDVPAVVTVHSIWPQSWLTVRAANLPYWAMPLRAEWSAVSTLAARRVGEVLSAVATVQVVPNIVETEWWRPAGPIRAGQPNVVRILTVGRLAGRKRVGPLLEVLAAAHRQLDGQAALDVTIVGEGSRHRDLARFIEKHQMSHWVRLVGQRSPAGIRELLHQSDLFVAPAHRESFGIAALEARSAGVPVVGFRASGLADFIADGVEGVLVGSDAELVQALAGLAVAPDRLAGLRAHTHQHAPSIAAADSVHSVEQLYARALDGHGIAVEPSLTRLLG